MMEARGLHLAIDNLSRPEASAIAAAAESVSSVEFERSISVRFLHTETIAEIPEAVTNRDPERLTERRSERHGTARRRESSSTRGQREKSRLETAR